MDVNSNFRTTTNTLENNRNSINLLDYLEIIALHRKMIFKSIITTTLLSIVVSLCISNTYSSKALIIPPQQDSSGLMSILLNSASGSMGSMASDILGKSSPADMYVSILNSEVISDKIINRFKLMEVYNKKYRIDAYKKLNDNVEIIAGKKDGIITITVEDKDPNRASEIANVYVDELSSLLLKLNMSGANQNRVFYEERLSKAKDELKKSEDMLKFFQSRNKVLDITEQAKVTIKGIAELEAQLAIHEVQLATLRRTLTDNSQEIKFELSTISNIKAQISKFEGQRTSVSVPGVESVPNLAQQSLRILRDFKTQEAIVELLTKQNELAKLSEAKDTVSIQIIQSARPSDKKIKPKRSLIVIASFFTSGFIAILFAFVLESTKHMSLEQRIRFNNIISMFQPFSLLDRQKNQNTKSG